MKFKLKLKPPEYERVPFHVRIHRHLCKDEGTCYSTDKNRIGSNAVMQVAYFKFAY